MQRRSLRIRPAMLVLVMLLALNVALVTLGSSASPALRWLILALTCALGASLLAERRAQARAQRAIYSLGEILSSPGPGSPLQSLASLALELIPGACRCAIHLTDPQGRLEYARAVAPQASGAPLPLLAASPLALRALQERRSLTADDLAPSAMLAQGESEGLAPACAVPIGSEEMLGVMVLYTRGGHRLDTQELAHATLLALATGVLLREERLREAIRSEAPSGELILNTLTDALVVLDDEDRVLLYNPALAAVLGPELSGLKGAHLQVRSTDVRVQRLAYLVGDTSGDRPRRRQLAIDEPVHAVLEIETVPVRDPSGRWLRVVTMHDVTASTDAAEAQTHLLRATAHGLQAPLAALTTGPAAEGLAQPTRALERLRQDLLAVAEPLENLAQSATPTVPWSVVLGRLEAELPYAIANRLRVHSHPALDGEPVPDRWLDHLLLTLIEQAGRGGEGPLSLDVEGRPGELVFSVRGPSPGREAAAPENPLGFGASETTLSLQVAHRLAQAIGGHLWQAQDEGALRYQLILATASRRAHQRTARPSH